LGITRLRFVWTAGDGTAAGTTAQGRGLAPIANGAAATGPMAEYETVL
jgi:hypothetical protein